MGIIWWTALVNYFEFDGCASHSNVGAILPISSFVFLRVVVMNAQTHFLSTREKLQQYHILEQNRKKFRHGIRISPPVCLLLLLHLLRHVHSHSLIQHCRYEDAEARSFRH